MCPCDPTTGHVCTHHRGGPEGSGADNAYEHDVRVEYARGVADALRRAWDAMVSPQGFGLDSAGTRIACEQVERVAREMGVQL